MSLLFLLFPLLLIACVIGVVTFGAHLVLRFVRAYERRNDGAELAEPTAARLRMLEETVARMERELDEVSEGQRFTNRLLAGRATPDVPPAGTTPDAPPAPPAPPA